ncbi:MAG: hypothetical protein ACRC1K_12695 [Planctomycetia bacterium]
MTMRSESAGFFAARHAVAFSDGGVGRDLQIGAVVGVLFVGLVSGVVAFKGNGAGRTLQHFGVTAGLPLLAGVGFGADAPPPLPPAAPPPAPPAPEKKSDEKKSEEKKPKDEPSKKDAAPPAKPVGLPTVPRTVPTTPPTKDAKPAAPKVELPKVDLPKIDPPKLDAPTKPPVVDRPKAPPSESALPKAPALDPPPPPKLRIGSSDAATVDAAMPTVAAPTVSKPMDAGPTRLAPPPPPPDFAAGPAAVPDFGDEPPPPRPMTPVPPSPAVRAAPPPRFESAPTDAPTDAGVPPPIPKAASRFQPAPTPAIEPTPTVEPPQAVADFGDEPPRRPIAVGTPRARSVAEEPTVGVAPPRPAALTKSVEPAVLPAAVRDVSPADDDGIRTVGAAGRSTVPDAPPGVIATSSVIAIAKPIVKRAEDADYGDADLLPTPWTGRRPIATTTSTARAAAAPAPEVAAEGTGAVLPPEEFLVVKPAGRNQVSPVRVDARGVQIEELVPIGPVADGRRYAARPSTPSAARSGDADPVQVVSYDVDSRIALPGDTFAGFAQSHYGSREYVEPLMAYNRWRGAATDPLRSGVQVRLPPASVLRAEQLKTRLGPAGRSTDDAARPGAIPVATSARGDVAKPSGVGVRATDVAPAAEPPPGIPSAVPRGAAAPAVIPTTSIDRRSTAGGVDAASYDVYRTTANESLYAIAKKSLGNGGRWQEIFDLNKDQLREPLAVVPAGTSLKLPKKR